MELIKPDNIIEALEKQVLEPLGRVYRPMLVVIQNQNCEADSASYVRQMQRAAHKYGATLNIVSAEDAMDAADKINTYKSLPTVYGIIIVSDFGEQTKNLRNLIPPRLDLDCSSTFSIGRLVTNNSPLSYREAPCPVAAAMKILDYNGFADLTGKKAAVLGRSIGVGRLVANSLIQKNATVTVFHSKSHEIDLSDYDVIISAIGKPEIVNLGMFPNGIKAKIIIDIGINVNDEGKLCGDVHLDSFKHDDAKITPVPGGVGKLATTILFTKLFVHANSIREDVVCLL